MSPWMAFYRRLAALADRPAGIQVEHTVPPADVVDEPESPIEVIDRKLAAIRAVPAPVRPESSWRELDRLLDLRNAIHRLPSLPDAPGGAS